jgi:hypothetical protein
MIDSEEHGLWAQIDDTVLAVQSDARREQLPGWYARHVAEARLHRLGRWPAPFDIAVPHDAHDDSWIVDAYGWLDRQLPVRSELTARQWFDDSRFSYSSGGLLPVGPVAIAAFLLALAALVFGIRWSASRLFLADLRVPRHANAAALDDEWDRCEPHEKFVLMQVADEHIANPQQRTTVEELARKGLLILEPDLRPRTAALEARIRNEARTSAPLKEWEAASGERSWHSVRTVLFATIAVGGVFLFATQPGLQSDLAGLASGIVTAGGLAVKVRDSITAWIDPTHVRT